MAWKAECNRRKWYCILGWDAVSWFSEYSYNEWRRSLTPEQIRKLEEYEKKQKEKREKRKRLGKCFCCNSDDVQLYLEAYVNEGQIAGKERSKL